MDNKFIEIFKGTYNGTKESLQQSLIELKKSGCNPIEAVKIIVNQLGLSLKEADSIVLNSEAWRTEKDQTLKLRNDFFDALSDFEDKPE